MDNSESGKPFQRPAALQVISFKTVAGAAVVDVDDDDVSSE
jgi:hypothetical protein